MKASRFAFEGQDIDVHDDLVRRLHFAAWPQAHAHASWIEAVEHRLGVTLPRGIGPGAGLLDVAVAHALMHEAGVDPSAPTPVDRLPPWALLPEQALRHRSSVVAARPLVPELRRAVSGEAARRWEEVLGSEVRGTVLLSSVQGSTPPPSARFRQALIEASHSRESWQVICLRLALGALAGLGLAAWARLRMAWPLALRRHEPYLAQGTDADWFGSAMQAYEEAAPTGGTTGCST